MNQSQEATGDNRDVVDVFSRNTHSRVLGCYTEAFSMSSKKGARERHMTDYKRRTGGTIYLGVGRGFVASMEL